MTKTSCLNLLLVFGVVVAAVACDNETKTDTGNGSSTTDDTGSDCLDNDNDGFCSDVDCDDDNADVNPDADEECDNVDNDCDGDIDEDVTTTYYADTDDDGFGDSVVYMDACEAPPGWVPNAEDCDDSDPTVYPNAIEECDGIDNDCDGDIDEELDSQSWYADMDGDGWGDPDSAMTACEQPTGYVNNDLDCDDSDTAEPVIVSQSGPVTPAPSPAPDTGETGWLDTGSSGTGTAADPYERIQEGVDASRVCVHVYDGTYNEDIDFNGKNVEVVGINGADNTIIEGTGAGAVVTFNSGEGAGATLKGFTVTGGKGYVTVEQETDDTCGSPATCTTTIYSYYGGGIYIDSSSPTLEDLIVTGNELPPYSYRQTSPYDWEYVYSFGGGVFAKNSLSQMRSTVFSKNRADAGGGLFFDANCNIDLTWVTADLNLASSGGGLTSEGDVKLQNNIFVNNASTGTHNIGGAGVDLPGGSALFINSSLVGNDGIASVFVGDGASASLLNNILYDNDDGYMIEAESSSSSATISYNDVYNGSSTAYGPTLGDYTGIDGNISENPTFVDWTDDDDYTNDDLKLDAGSPCIDAGSTASAYNDASDGSRNDMGAYGGPYGTW